MRKRIELRTAHAKAATGENMTKDTIKNMIKEKKQNASQKQQQKEAPENPETAQKEAQKAEAQKRFMHIKMLLRQLEQGEKQVEAFDSQLTELRGVREGLEELSKVPAGTDVYVPVSGGIFMRATVKEPEKLLVNVGSGMAVSKTIPDTARLIDEQIGEIRSARSQLAEQAQLIRKHLQGMQKELSAFAESEA